MRILSVIIAGGAGQRLWPVSLPHRPKPFVPLLAGGTTLFSRTLKRAFSLGSDLPPLVVCNSAHASLVRELAGDHSLTFLLEPEPRDTAPAICAAALCAQQRHGGDVVLVVMPADHYIENTAEFRTTILMACGAAEGQDIVTIGIPPTRPATEFGYLGLKEHDAEDGVYDVQHFIEKPDEARAIQLINGSNYWNAGLFLARADTLVRAFRDHAEDILDNCQQAMDAAHNGSTIQLDPRIFGATRKISIDYAIMEKHGAIRAVKATFDWQDLGNWAAIFAISPKDSDGNCVIGNARCEGSRSNYLRCSRSQMTVTGCTGLVAIEDNGFVLVMPLAAASTLRELAHGTTSHVPAGGRLTINISWCGGDLDIENGGETVLCVSVHGA
jgi:mannose-1-phosphate guanylyltransferase / mannose-6-phosphate isomerase